MRLVIDLQKILSDKINKLDIQIADVKFERDNSATPMESASDKSRQLAEQLMDALGDERKKLVLLEKKISKIKSLNIYTLATPLGERDFLIIPDGLGGRSIDEITLLSDESPLGQILITKKNKANFKYNNQEFTVLNIKKSII